MKETTSEILALTEPVFLFGAVISLQPPGGWTLTRVTPVSTLTVEVVSDPEGMARFQVLGVRLAGRARTAEVC